MTIHTLWGDFESEEELIKTGARMMGISYDQAKKIREKALKDHAEEKRRIEEAIQRRKDLEQSILNKIKERFPDIHFKPCPWCNEEPHIEVSVCCNYWLNEKDRPKSYRVELHSCEHLNETGSVLNGYDIDEIPETPTHRNPKWTWTGAWEDHGWEYAVKHYEEYLSPDYKRKCAVCGVKWRGWEDINVSKVDGKQYCHKCFGELFSEENNGKRYARPDLYRDSRNLSTMYDGGPQFYTSFKRMREILGMTDESKIVVKHKDKGIEEMASSRMSGDMRGNRYEIYYGYFQGYVWRPKDLDELKKYMRVKNDR